MSVERETLISFSGQNDQPDWMVVNDDVRGGVSQGRVEISDGAWIEAMLPLADIMPTYRGRQLDGPC